VKLICGMMRSRYGSVSGHPFALRSTARRSQSPRRRGVVFRYFRKRIYILLTRQPHFTHYILPKGAWKTGNPRPGRLPRNHRRDRRRSLCVVGLLGVRSRLSFNKKKWTTTRYFLFSSDQLRPGATAHDQYQARWFNIDKLPPILWREQAGLISLARGKITKYLANDARG